MAKLKERYFQILLIIVLFLGGWSTYVFNNNDYLTYRDINVTYVDRHASKSCYKGSCSDRLIGLFKTDGGYFFERNIGLYTYSQMHLGERFALTLRPMDIKQTPYNNVVWMIGPIILYAVSFVFSVLLIFDFFYTPKQKDLSQW